jgi:hypothetical protein
MGRNQTKIYIGNTTFLGPAPVKLIKELSRPGYVCLYQTGLSVGTINGDIEYNAATSSMTDIVLYNPTDFREVL